MEEYAVRPNIRSASGIVMMLAIIPIFAGLLACMPVPIGDPEKSRIDPDFNGVWTIDGESDAGAIYFFRPYDKRTWLLLAAGIVESDDYEGDELDIDSAQDVFDILAAQYVCSGGITADDFLLQKVWLKKIGGVTFMTWESVGFHDGKDLHLPEYWWVWKVDKAGVNEFRLSMINIEHDVFDDVDELDDDRSNLERVRRQVERAIRKAADDPDLYIEEDGALVFRRVPDELLEATFELFEEVVDLDLD